MTVEIIIWPWVFYRFRRIEGDCFEVCRRRSWERVYEPWGAVRSLSADPMHLKNALLREILSRQRGLPS